MLTEASRRSDFPALSEMTYLNTAAESIPPQCVHDALERYWKDKSRGMKGQDGHFAERESCREICAHLLRLRPDEIGFCSCSSEAYNLLASALELGAGDEVVVSDLDFPAGATPWMRMLPAPAVRLWKSASGSLKTADLMPLLNERTRLVQVSAVSFYNGHRLAWEEVRDAVRRAAPRAVLSVDVTQALGRIPFDCDGAEVIISSTHKWTLGIHGGCIVGLTGEAAALRPRAGGWFNLKNAFDADRFERAEPKSGAAGFSVGMPGFAALYALNSSLRYLDRIGIPALAAHADPLAHAVDRGLRLMGLEPMCGWDPRRPSGIVAFRHPRNAEIRDALEREGIHILYHAGRLRISIHGYNTPQDIARLLDALGRLRLSPSPKTLPPLPTGVG